MLLVDTEGTRSDRFGCDKVLRSSKLWFLSVFVVRTYEMPAIQVTRSARHRDRNNMDTVDVAHSFQPLIGHEWKWGILGKSSRSVITAFRVIYHFLLLK